jgi:hypothetical protein
VGIFLICTHFSGTQLGRQKRARYDDDDDDDDDDDNNNKTCMLINVAISGDRNVIKKVAEKILKYKDLTIEIQCVWNVKTKVIPVIIGATGTISK